MSRRDNRWCLICNPRNRTLYWHVDQKTGKPWCYCNKCDRGYSLEQYCEQADISPDELLTGDFYIEEDKTNEVQAQTWPHSFIPLSDPRATKGVEYVKSRCLTTDGDMYYDMEEEGIVFPYYYGNHFCGAQVRFIEDRIQEDGVKWKITTMPGTRLGLLFYGWNQEKLMPNVKGIVITEGAFNALAIQQSLNQAYGGISKSPWRVFACSGSGVSEYQKETLKDLKTKGYKVVVAPDTDEAGFRMYEKIADCVTHYAFTQDTDKDWNDILKDRGHLGLAKFFISSIKETDVSEEEIAGRDRIEEPEAQGDAPTGDQQ